MILYFIIGNKFLTGTGGIIICQIIFENLWHFPFLWIDNKV